MNNILIAIIVCLGAVLLFSPESLLSNTTENQIIVQIRAHAQLIGATLVGVGGYMFYQTQQDSASDYASTTESTMEGTLPSYDEATSEVMSAARAPSV
jgi:hypothetical protein